MKYEVVTTATAVWRIIVEADSKEQAQEKVFEGEYDLMFDIPDDYINEEVHEVNEVKE
jgi:hypothetical protein